MTLPYLDSVPVPDLEQRCKVKGQQPKYLGKSLFDLLEKMASATLFSSDCPIYAVGRLAGSDAEFYVAGGGGQARTGVPNALVSDDLRRGIHMRETNFFHVRF